MKGFPTIMLLFFFTLAHSQDTLRVMHYNLLNYGNNYGDCNSTNNNVDNKNDYLKTIVDHLHPDILTVNEIDENDYYHDYLLDNVFNPEGGSQYKRVDLPNLANAPIMNQLFYNGGNLTLLSNVAVETNYRDIDIITFEYAGTSTQTPVPFGCIVAHLKAGSDPEDAQERASETYKLMNYLNDHGLDGNFILSGDLNLYSGSESAFQNLLLYSNESLRFYDPLNKVGEWHANPFFAGIHTQSTHLSGDCPSGGGMDDRFDFILASKEIMEGSMGMRYIPASYRAIGQDGMRFDQSLINPANNSVPQDVLTALYGMSDHLPLLLDMELGIEPGNVHENDIPVQLLYRNPATAHVSMSISARQPVVVEIRIIDQTGRVKWACNRTAGPEPALLLADRLVPGLYFIVVRSGSETPLVRKLVVAD